MGVAEVWWQFKSALVRKLAYVLVALAVAAVFGHHRAWSQTCTGTFVWQETFDSNGTTFSSGAALCAAWAAYATAASGTGGTTYTCDHAWVPGAPTYAGQPNSIYYGCSQGSYVCPGVSLAGNEGTGIQATGSQCPSGCGTAPNQDILAAIAAESSVDPATGTMCVNMPDGTQCGYTNGGAGAVNVNVGSAYSSGAYTAGASNGYALIGKAVPTGASCGTGSSGSAVAALPASCFKSGGTTLCVDDLEGASQAQINNDVVVPASAPASGTCQSYASGGVLCTVPSSGTMPAPPAPTTSASGGTAAASPDAQVNNGTTTYNYYNSTTVANSPTPVGTKGTGSTNTGSGDGTGTGTSGSGTGACPAGQTCSGTSDSYSGGTDCSTAPVCTDTDPVQCAQANQVWLLMCTPTSYSQLSGAIATDPGDTGTGPSSTTQDMSSVVGEHGLISASASAECPAPVSFTVMGNTISWDIYGPMCQFAGLLSTIVMMVAYAISARVMLTGTIANTL